ncbi:hypothetical protein [Ferrimonas kyonanensis]|uniref:hypothetical protein n=1 Tax=Ferrimonas kyonanensis TaxID=364763 RepID=UPI000418D9B9|nr:hypothetical protein [Ferrimonas kyonanensis]
MNKYLYVALSGGSGALNVVTILLFVRALGVESSDLFLFTLAFVNFVVILCASPINTGKLKYLINKYDSDEDIKRAVSHGLYLVGLKYTPYLLILVLAVFFCLLKTSSLNYNDSLLSYSLIVSIYSISCVLYDWNKIELQIEKSFIEFSAFNLFLNLIAVLCVYFLFDSVVDFLILLGAIRFVFVLYCSVRRHQDCKNSEVNVSGDMQSEFNEMISTLKFYSFSVFFTGLSAFLPGYLLSFYQTGYLTAYQLAYRFITAPLSLLITPFVDYVRYSLKTSLIMPSDYTKNVVVVLSFTIFLSGGLLVFSREVSSFFLHDEQYVEIFVSTMQVLALSMVSGALYILNTRLAELRYSISRMSTIGLSIHCAYILLIIFSTCIRDFDYFVLSRLVIDLFVFLPVSFYFLKRSNAVQSSET